MSDLPLFDSHEELRQMLFASLEAEGFRCAMGIPIQENNLGQVYTTNAIIAPVDTLTTKEAAIKVFRNIAIANYTSSSTPIHSFDSVVWGEHQFDYSRAIEFRSIDLCRHSLKKDYIYFYLRGVSRNESDKIKWQYDSEGKIERAENESTNQDN